MARTRSSNGSGPDGTAATRSRPSMRRSTPRSVTTLVTRAPGAVTYAATAGRRRGRPRVTTTQAAARLTTSLAPPDPTSNATVPQAGGVEVPVLVHLGRAEAPDRGRPGASDHHAEHGGGVGQEGGPGEDAVVEDVGIGRRRGVPPQAELGGEVDRASGRPGPGHRHPGGQVGHAGAGQHGIGPVLGHGGLDFPGAEAGRHLPVADRLVDRHRIGVGVAAPRLGIGEQTEADQPVVSQVPEVGGVVRGPETRAPGPRRRSPPGPRRPRRSRRGCPRRSRPPAAPVRSIPRDGHRTAPRPRPAPGGRGSVPGDPARRGRRRSSPQWPPLPGAPPRRPTRLRAEVRRRPDCPPGRPPRRGGAPHREPEEPPGPRCRTASRPW